MEEKLAPIVVIIDEFADLADQLESKKEQNAFYKPVQRIAQAGRSRGIHLVMLVPTASKKARTQYSVYAVEYRHRLIPLNLALANRVIDNQMRNIFKKINIKKPCNHCLYSDKELNSLITVG